MVKYKEIIAVGEELRKNGGIDTIATIKLYDRLTKATGSYSRKTLVNYLKILKKEGYIEYTNGRWRIVRINRTLL